MVRKGVIGIPQDGRMTACSYTVKHYEEGSVFGIDGGRISKLAIKIDGKTTCCYQYFSFLAIFQVLQCAFLIFHVFQHFIFFPFFIDTPP